MGHTFIPLRQLRIHYIYSFTIYCVSLIFLQKGYHNRKIFHQISKIPFPKFLIKKFRTLVLFFFSKIPYASFPDYTRHLFLILFYTTHKSSICQKLLLREGNNSQWLSCSIWACLPVWLRPLTLWTFLLMGLSCPNYVLMRYTQKLHSNCL